MKKFIIFYFLSLFSNAAFCQMENYYDLNFDDTDNLYHLSIDTTSNPNNIWQVGMVQKSIFSSAYSAPNVIVTDTLNAYAPNDTSIFTLTNIVSGLGFIWPHTIVFSGQYFVNSDSLTDFGIIELSPDNGDTWIDLINDTIYNALINWGLNKPTLTGNSNGWVSFYALFPELGPIFNIQIGDTIIYRFTFISDSVQTFKDGLMFDDFHFEDYAEGIEEVHNNNLLSIYPNPAGNHLSININSVSSTQSIQIINHQGEVVYNNPKFTSTAIDVSSLPNGLYFLRYSNSASFSVNKFIVSH